MRARYTTIIVLLAAVGAVAAAELTWVHYKVHTDPGHRSLCAVSAAIDCDAVAATPAATVLGVPNALWALLTYVLLIGLALRARRLEGRPSDAPPPPFPSAPRTWLFWASLAIAAYTAWLVVVSATGLGVFCLFCAALWLVNALILAASLTCVRGAAPVAGLRRELAAVRRAPVPFLALVVPLALVAALLVAFVPRLYPSGPRLSEDVRLPMDAIPAGAASRGPAAAAHVLVAFSDYRCPHCRAANDAIERARRLAPDRLRVVHLHFPLEGDCNPLLDRALHPGACRAARAAECAHAEGRFWELHDALFAWDGPWSEDVPLDLAVALGFDRGDFARCLEDDRAARDAIARDVALGERLGVDGTPMIYVDGHEHAGPLTVPEILDLVGD